MKVKKGLFFCACLGLSFAAWTASSSASDVLSTYTKQTLLLKPGSAHYAEWKAWIEQQNAQDPALKRSDGSFAVGEVGSVTVILETALTPSAETTISSVPPNNGPPTPLPVNGTPGQRITVVNQTTTLYQKWVYEWAPAGNAWGWNQVAYSAHSCELKPGLTGVFCPASAD